LNSFSEPTLLHWKDENTIETVMKWRPIKMAAKSEFIKKSNVFIELRVGLGVYVYKMTK